MISPHGNKTGLPWENGGEGVWIFMVWNLGFTSQDLGSERVIVSLLIYNGKAEFFYLL